MHQVIDFFQSDEGSNIIGNFATIVQTLGLLASGAYFIIAFFRRQKEQTLEKTQQYYESWSTKERHETRLKAIRTLAPYNAGELKFEQLLWDVDRANAISAGLNEFEKLALFVKFTEHKKLRLDYLELQTGTNVIKSWKIAYPFVAELRTKKKNPKYYCEWEWLVNTWHKEDSQQTVLDMDTDGINNDPDHS